MKHLLAKLALAIALTVPAGMAQAQDARPTVDRPGHREFGWDGGDTLGVSGAMSVRVRKDGPARVVVTGPEELVERVFLRRGHLGFNDSWWGGNFNWNGRRVEVEISGVSLDNVSVSGSSQVTLGSLQQDALTVRISGSGSISADGRVNRLDARISGSGSARLPEMRARDGWLSVSGSGSIFVNAIETADLSVSGSGRITSEAIQSAKVSISGSGQVRIDGRPRQLSQSISGSGQLVAGGVTYSRRTRELERQRERERERAERERERELAREEREREREMAREERERERRDR